MAENSKISWTDHTFNPWIGCTKVSAGCAHCYAESQNKRYSWVDQWGPSGSRRRTSESNWRKPLEWQRRAEKLDVRYKVFCASLADVFENRDELIDWRLDLFETVIGRTPRLDWLILTKRPEIAAEFFRFRHDLLFENVWMGVTIESQDYVDRLHLLASIDATVKFVSYEPAIGPLVLNGYAGNYRYNWLGFYERSVNWVICGGESGSGSRPMDLAWARSMRDQCADVGVPFFMKQLGGHPDKRDRIEEWPEDLQIQEFPRL